MFWSTRRREHHEHPAPGHRRAHHHHRFCEPHADRGGPRGGGPGSRMRGRFGGDDATGGWFGGEPPRADRGGVRYLVLDAIAEQPRHGYEIIQAIGAKSRETYKPSPGVVYPTLQMLEELGHAKNAEIEGRKAFTITEAGAKELAEHRDYVDEFYERVSDNPWDAFAHDFSQIRDRLHMLMKTFKRALRRGQLSSAALGDVIKVLDEAVERIQRIFADDQSRKP